MSRSSQLLTLGLPIIVLVCLGLVVLNSVAPQLFLNQLLFVLVFVIALAVFRMVGFSLLSYFWLPAYLLSLAFLLLPYIFGVISRGAQRWLIIGPFYLQPSEIVKPFLLITFAYLSSQDTPKSKQLLFILGVIPILLIFKQPDLGSALVLSTGWFICLINSISLKKILLLISALAIIALPLYNFVLADYQKSRIATFINPYQDPLGSGYHVIQSVISVGSGKIFGRGLGHGTQSQLKFLPEHHTDFIFASLSEELGLMGSLMTLLAYIFFLLGIFKIAQIQKTKSYYIFCISAMVMLAFQICVNIGMNLGIAPITGITLPLLSYGGSSLLSVGITLGLIFSLANSSPRDYHDLQIR